MKIQVEVDVDAIRKDLTNLQKKAFPVALSRAVNRAADTVRFELIQGIAGITGLKQGGETGTRKALPIRGSTSATLTATIYGKATGPNLVRQMSVSQRAAAKNFWKGKPGSPKDRKGATSVFSVAWGSSRSHPKLFSAPTGGIKGEFQEAIFKRTRKKVVPRKGRYKGRNVTKGKNKGKPLMRELLAAAYGETVAQAMLRPVVQAKAEETFRRRFAEDLPRQLEFATNQILKRMKWTE